jgi:hypothetical protein
MDVEISESPSVVNLYFYDYGNVLLQGDETMSACGQPDGWL